MAPPGVHSPMCEDRLLGLSRARLLGLFSKERFARDISAVTLVIVILKRLKLCYKPCILLN